MPASILSVRGGGAQLGEDRELCLGEAVWGHGCEVSLATTDRR